MVESGARKTCFQEYMYAKLSICTPRTSWRMYLDLLLLATVSGFLNTARLPCNLEDTLSLVLGLRECSHLSLLGSVKQSIPPLP